MREDQQQHVQPAPQPVPVPVPVPSAPKGRHDTDVFDFSDHDDMDVSHSGGQLQPQSVQQQHVQVPERGGLSQQPIPNLKLPATAAMQKKKALQMNKRRI